MNSNKNSLELENEPAGSIPQKAKVKQDDRKAPAAVKPQTRKQKTDQNGGKKKTSLPCAHQENEPAGSIPQKAKIKQDDRKVPAAVKPQRKKKTDQNGGKKETSLSFAHQDDNEPAGSIPQNTKAKQDDKRKVPTAAKPRRKKKTDQRGSKKKTLPFTHQAGAFAICTTNNDVVPHPVGDGLMVDRGLDGGAPDYHGTHFKDQRQHLSSSMSRKPLELAPALDDPQNRQHHRPDVGHNAMPLLPPVPGAIRLGPQGMSDGLDFLEHDDENPSNEMQQPNTSYTSNVEENIMLEAVLVQSNIEDDRQRLEQQIRNEFLRSVVTGEVTPVTPNKKMGKFGILAVVLVIGIIGIAVGVAVGTGNPSAMPTISPILRPTNTPSDHPSVTLEPSTAPTSMPSFQPSVAPSRSIANLDNRKLEEAHPLTLRTAPLANNLANVADQSFGIDCGNSEWVQGAGLWYVYKARTSGPVHVIVCGGSASVSTYQGSGSGGSFTCLENRFFNVGDIGNCGGSSISWKAKAGEQYHALVSQSLDEQNPITVDGDFTIQIVDNDQCDHAAGPITPTSVGAVMSYTTINAEADGDVASTCGGASASTSPGVWYQVEGTGEAITASTCDDETTFNTQISVFRGECGSLVCVNGNNDFCGSQSTVVWPSVLNETYFVHVHGVTNDDKGSFKLTLSTDTPRVENDFCDTAVVVAEGDFLTFAFSGSSADPDLPQCGDDGTVEDTGSAEFPYGIWYSFVGTGLSVAATLNTVTRSSSVTMNIYSGSSCGSLSCVANERSRNCKGCELVLQCTATACIPTTLGQVYYVFLSTESLESIDDEHSLVIRSC